MTPDPAKTNLELAEEFDVAAGVAQANHDFVFAATLTRHAHHLRIEHERKLNGLQHSIPPATGERRGVRE